MAGQPKRSTTSVKADILRQIASDAGRSLQAAVKRRNQRTVLINVKVTEKLSVALANRAAATGITRKQVSTRSLDSAGLPVDPLDLEDCTLYVAWEMRAA